MKKKGKSKEDAEFEARLAKMNAMLPKSYLDEQKINQKPKQTQQQKIKNAVREGKKVEVVQKGVGNKVNQINNVGKLLNEDVDIKTVPREISVQISQARNEKKLTQEQLANKISENVSVVKDLESGNGAYNPKVVNKIEKALGVNFKRSWKKEQ